MIKLPDIEKSFWRLHEDKPRYSQLSSDLKVDVVIIGAGITGLSSAYLLKKSGLKVAVTEKRTVGSGTTGRTTGKVTSQHNLIYSFLENKFGPNTAKNYGQANQSAVELIRDIVAKEKISCDYQVQDNYVFTTKPAQAKKFQNEAKVAASIGLPASFVRSSGLPFEVAAAVKFTGQSQFHAQKYLNGLARAVAGNGCHIFENTSATGIRDGEPCRVKTNNGTITAKHIIVATNVPPLPLMARGLYCISEYPIVSYIVAGKLDKNFGGMYISPDSGNYSILPVKNGDEKLLIIGGEGHISGLRRLKSNRYQKLAVYARDKFGITQFDYKWADRDYLGYDSMPLIGKVYPWSKHLYTGTGFSKWGLSGGTVAAMILHDEITGKPNPWAKTFSSTRLEPLKSIPRVAAAYARHPFSANH